MVILEVAMVFLVAASSPVGAASIINTKHNLSVSGPGDLVAVDEQRVCIFCHTPHHASPEMPLWSREVGGTSYNLYASTTLHAQPGQPTGASRLCLSCHDGTIALGMLYERSEPIPFVGGVGAIPASRSTNLQTDLSDDHPVSFP
ncbi:MAG: cytochrome C, partial [Deltaproteobacteria bacterium]|nr:cytochrome C [Deltaproteobacteria bacterium]